MKLTTEIIKVILINEFGVGNWKRLKKCKEGDKVLRVFSNNVDTFNVYSNTQDE
jgi:hypothetical protein